MIFQESLDIKDIKEWLCNCAEAWKQSPSRTFLAIDSSTSLASVAVVSSGKTLYSEECFRQKSHSEWMNGAIERAILTLENGWHALELIAFIHGPGSFTGLRVSTNIAKTIAYSYGLPLVGMSSLEILAYQVKVQKNHTTLVLPVINAFKNRVFCALFLRSQDHCEMLIPPHDIEVEKLESFLISNKKNLLSDSIVVVGDGFTAYQDAMTSFSQLNLKRLEASQDFPTAASLAQIVQNHAKNNSFLHWKEVVPVYLRASAAEEALRK